LSGFPVGYYPIYKVKSCPHHKPLPAREGDLNAENKSRGKGDLYFLTLGNKERGKRELYSLSFEGEGEGEVEKAGTNKSIMAVKNKWAVKNKSFCSILINTFNSVNI